LKDETSNVVSDNPHTFINIVTVVDGYSLCVCAGRQATEKERTHGGVLKDMDLVMNKAKLHLGSKKAAFMVQVEKDAMFLAELNIMDYSLLVQCALQCSYEPLCP
jgi:Phosphatidylinositol-4-phosphate 5-Kinase